MKKSQPVPETKVCNKLLKAIGDYWTLSIIEALGQGEKRFCELERTLVGVNPVTLTARLKIMEEIGFITRAVDSEKKIPVVYNLTIKGRELLPITTSIRVFAEGFHRPSKK